MKIRNRLLLFISAALLLVGVAVYFLIQIPITRILSKKILDLPALRTLHVQVEKVEAAASGKVTLRGVSILGKDVLSIPSIVLMIDRKKFLHGIVFIESVQMDTLKIDVSKISKIKDQLTPENENWFHGKLSLFQKTPMTVKSVRNMSGMNWSMGDLRFKIDSVFADGSLGRVRMKSVNIEGLPAAKAVELKFNSNANSLNLEKLSCTWADGKVKGGLVLDRNDPAFPFKGKLDLDQINTARFKKLGGFSGTIADGSVHANMYIQGSLNHLEDVQVNGNINISKIRLKKFPLGQSQFVEKYFPNIKDLRLSSLDLTGVSWKKNRLEFAEILGQGYPLSFTGHGKLGSNGKPSLRLNCVMDPKFFQGMSPMFRNTGEIKIQIDSVFAFGLLGRAKVNRLSPEGMPDAQDLELKFALDSNALSINTLVCKWADGNVRGALVVNPMDTTLPFKGSLDFQQINMSRFTALGFFSGANVEGRMLGKVEVRGQLSRLEAIRADGNAKILKVRLKKFPVQRDKLIVKYLPSLKDVRLNWVEVSAFSWKNTQIVLSGLRGQGSPLSFTGHGGVGVHGLHTLRLNCVFDQKFCRQLSPLIRGAFVVNSRVRERIPCEIKGDLHNQTLVVDKALRRVVGAILKTVGKGILEEFDLTD